MLRLHDIMTTEVVSLAPDMPVREALELLARRHLGGAPVVSNGKVVGVVTANDLMGLAAAIPGVPTERQQDDARLWGEAPIEEDVERELDPPSAYFAELWDDAGAEVSDRMSTSDSPEWNALEEHEVSEAMTRPPLVSFPPGTDVVVAAAAMRDRRIHRVLVMEGNRLLGIASAFDVMKAVAEGRLTRRVFAFNRDDEFPGED